MRGSQSKSAAERALEEVQGPIISLEPWGVLFTKNINTGTPKAYLHGRYEVWTMETRECAWYCNPGIKTRSSRIRGEVRVRQFVGRHILLTHCMDVLGASLDRTGYMYKGPRPTDTSADVHALCSIVASVAVVALLVNTNTHIVSPPFGFVHELQEAQLNALLVWQKGDDRKSQELAAANRHGVVDWLSSDARKPFGHDGSDPTTRLGAPGRQGRCQDGRAQGLIVEGAQFLEGGAAHTRGHTLFILQVCKNTMVFVAEKWKMQ